jgi:acyl phosphate:glycerol-3-phosphate acyltransferase
LLNVLAVICAYLLGSIPSALWIGKLFFKTDVREHGSGNLGGTNSFRVLGKKAGMAVTLMDILKGTAATLLILLPVFESVTIHALILGAIAVVGHMFPIFAGFRGGKAVATSAGVVLGYNWLLFLVLLAVFFLALKLWKMVSLASIVIAIGAFLYGVFTLITEQDVIFFIMITVLATFIVYRHKENMKRIKAGTEPKVKWL